MRQFLLFPDFISQQLRFGLTGNQCLELPFLTKLVRHWGLLLTFVDSVSVMNSSQIMNAFEQLFYLFWFDSIRKDLTEHVACLEKLRDAEVLKVSESLTDVV